MANNKTLKDGLGVNFTTKTTDTAGVNVSHVNVDILPIIQPLTDAELRAANVPVTQSIDNTTGNITALNANLNSGVPTAGSFVELTLNGSSGFAVDLRGTFVATLLIQGTINDSNWINLSVLPVGAGLNTAQVASATATGAWWGNGSAFKKIRITASAFTSGTVNVTLRAIAGANIMFTLPSGQTTQVISGVPTLGAGTANIGNVSLQIPLSVADVASAAITTTTTVASITPSSGISYQVNIPVTLVSGTNPTMDVRIEESDDGGTSWLIVHDFPRITANGTYRSALIPASGNRIRYVQTIGGTSPSFTRSINRLQSNYPALPVRQLVDRSIVLTTLNSVTPILLTRDCGNSAQLIINVGAIATTAPQIQMEGSDDFATTWYAIGTPLTAVANSTVQVTVTNINAGAMRARVSTAGVGVTAGYVMIKAHD
jgi:hypothetical protein